MTSCGSSSLQMERTADYWDGEWGVESRPHRNPADARKLAGRPHRNRADARKLAGRRWGVECGLWRVGCGGWSVESGWRSYPPKAGRMPLEMIGISVHLPAVLQRCRRVSAD
jgi:hypothetical protein